jgi:hypothetical protein
MGKIKIKKGDKNRVLLTEVLPYEVPIIFSNSGFYLVVRDNSHIDIFDEIKKLSPMLKSAEPSGIPFNFELKKNINNDTRVLSVIHPICQLGYIDLYEKYNSLILHLCSKSDISLRRTSKVASFCYTPNLIFDEDSHKNNEVEEEPDILDQETMYVKSYFTYKPINLIYKFYDRTEFRRLEQKFYHMMKFDIQKCFYSIYTHSIAWAIKGKTYAKANKCKVSFEREFDRLMQHSNYDETNGVVVGPEFSRIFAEIILQRIDIEVIDILKENYKYGVDYEVRRYIDDYFVFANDKICLEKVQKVFRDKLSDYKLYINQSKTETKTSPFITDVHVAKREIKQLLELRFGSIYEEHDSVDDADDKVSEEIA